MEWLDAPTHAGFWWIRRAEGSDTSVEPVRVTWGDADDAYRYSVDFIGSDERDFDADIARRVVPLRWLPIALPVDVVVAHADLAPVATPEPLTPCDAFVAPSGNPGARVVRTG